MDFFDNYNNKILESLNYVINRQTYKKIEEVEDKLKYLIDKTDKLKMRNFYDITLTMKSYIDTPQREKTITKHFD